MTEKQKLIIELGIRTNANKNVHLVDEQTLATKGTEYVSQLFGHEPEDPKWFDDPEFMQWMVQPKIYHDDFEKVIKALEPEERVVLTAATQVPCETSNVHEGNMDRRVKNYQEYLIRQHKDDPDVKKYLEADEKTQDQMRESIADKYIGPDLEKIKKGIELDFFFDENDDIHPKKTLQNQNIWIRRDDDFPPPPSGKSVSISIEINNENNGTGEEVPRNRPMPGGVLADPVYVPDNGVLADPVYVPDNGVLADPVDVPDNGVLADPVYVPDNEVLTDSVYVPNKIERDDAKTANKYENGQVIINEHHTQDPKYGTNKAIENAKQAKKNDDRSIDTRAVNTQDDRHEEQQTEL